MLATTRPHFKRLWPALSAALLILGGFTPARADDLLDKQRRENTLDDIRTIRAAVPELGLESFVHGALCVSYSGQCYMSGMISERAEAARLYTAAANSG